MSREHFTPWASTKTRSRKTRRAPQSTRRVQRAFRPPGGAWSFPHSEDVRFQKASSLPAAMAWPFRPWLWDWRVRASSTPPSATRRAWEDFPDSAKGRGEAELEDGALQNWTRTRGSFQVDPSAPWASSGPGKAVSGDTGETCKGKSTLTAEVLFYNNGGSYATSNRCL